MRTVSAHRVTNRTVVSRQVVETGGSPSQRLSLPRDCLIGGVKERILTVARAASCETESIQTQDTQKAQPAGHTGAALFRSGGFVHILSVSGRDPFGPLALYGVPLAWTVGRLRPVLHDCPQ